MEHLNIFFILLLLPTLSASQYNCPFAFCGSAAFIIRFPFRMVGQQPAVCGYPGFDLRCNRQGTMLLNIPKSGDFLVRTIDYRSQVIQVYDPSGCSASRLLNLDLSGSPFSVSATRNYTLLSCPVEVTTARFPTVDCLGNSTYSTLATMSVSFATAIANRTGCRVIGPLQYPTSRYQDQEGLASDLNLDISLTWDNPNCQDCAADGGTCGYTNTSMQEIACFNDKEKGNNKATIAMVIVSVGMALPAVAASIAIACYICRKDRRVSTWMARNTTPDTTTMPPETVATLWRGSLTIGLDPSTIESYTKVVLGESKRLPGHDDASCAICLSEYNVKETVRCIPECRHCFHAECIDEWLKLKGTCPVCRNSPSPAHVTL
ncbi:putative RING-H2 finger protein ATL21A [Cynara cardunculus var. scolymus]|uniref:putative RING-H2 finger protein ATL21A n=1 Tax=Cynara cardunculus var. scolymus TaxID=59895 RepID=UPI000D623E8E|nr:putative RING-H2 finger protein ATL21A [Cynara cardunculus var. scolymus]